MNHIRVLTLLFVFLADHAFAQNIKQKVNSKIEKVTLFTSGAQVTRKSSVLIPKGRTDLVFEGISPDIDKQSIQVNGQGQFTIVSVVHQINHLNEQKRQEEAGTISLKKESLLQKLVLEKNMLAVYKNEEQMLFKNQQIGGSDSGLKTADLKEAVEFHRAKLTENLAKQTEHNRNIQKLDSTLKKLDSQLKSLNQPKDFATSEVIVTVTADESLNAVFDLSYFTLMAGWYATYDLRVKDVESPLDLDFKAHVFQHSGEDWKDVKLTISNGNPTESGVAPQLEPWHLGFNSPRPNYSSPQPKTSGIIIKGALIGNEVRGRVTERGTGGALPGVNIMVKGATVGTVSNAYGYYSLKLPASAGVLVFSSVGYVSEETAITGGEISVAMEEDSRLLQEVVVTGYAKSSKRNFRKRESKSEELAVAENDRVTTMTYDIDLPYTILNDGKVYKVDIKKISVDAIYEYFTAPKLEKAAFLNAKIIDWQDLNLLEGEANLFFEGAYLGKSVIDLSLSSDTLSISLGKDKGITVDRKKIKNFSKRQFLSNSKIESRAYEIIARNNKKQPVSLIIQDQLPIPDNKEITLEDIEHKEGLVNESTKIITWKYTLQPKQEQKVLLKYAVKYPKDKVLVLE